MGHFFRSFPGGTSLCVSAGCSIETDPPHQYIAFLDGRISPYGCRDDVSLVSAQETGQFLAHVHGFSDVRRTFFCVSGELLFDVLCSSAWYSCTRISLSREHL